MNEMDSVFQPPLVAALRHAVAHLSPDEALPVAPTVDLDTLRRRLDLPLSENGMAAEIADELVTGVRGEIIDSAGGWST